MNKMFSTLLAGAALMSAVSANAADVTTIADKNLYQLEIGGNVLSTAKTKAGTADSLVMIAKTTKSVTSPEYKETLWKLTKVTVPNSSSDAYKLTNWATGVDLSLDLSKTDAKNGAIITAGKQSGWFVALADGKVKISAISDKKNYGLQVADLPVKDKDAIKNKVSLKKEFEGTEFTLVGQGTAQTLKADELNNLYGTAFLLDFEKDLEGNPIDAVALKAAKGVTDDCVTLQIEGDKYLVVDSVTWTNSVNDTKYWKLVADAKPTEKLDAEDYSTGITTATEILKNGRAKELYDFKVSLNVADGYNLTITPAYLPKFAANGDEKETKQTVPSFDIVKAERALSYGKFATSKEVLTAPATVTPADALKTATAVFGTVEVPAAIDADYTYYVKYKNTVTKGEKPKKNKDLNKFAYTNCDKAEAAAAATAAIPAYMWYLDANTMKNMMIASTEKEQPVLGNGIITIVDEKEAIYAFGSDTIQLTKGPKVDDAQKMGFKAVTKADEANGALSFRLVSALANDLYVVEKNGALYVANSELADALKLKVAAVEVKEGEEAATVGNKIVLPEYTITDRLGKKVLVANEENGSYKLSAEDDVTPVTVAFMVTNKENEYKIVIVEDGEYTTAITANAGSGILEVGALCADKNVTFEFAQKEAPKYAAPDYGHVKITTREDDGKFIASQTDGFAALKAVGQELKSSYTSDTLTMWLDTASTVFDEIMPLYYISTNAFTPDAKNNERNYLINPLNISKDIEAANEEVEDEADKVENPYPFTVSGYQSGYLAAFKTASACGSDSLAMEGDTINLMQLNPAAVAFEVAAELGDEYYRITSMMHQKNLKYDADEEGSLPYYEGVGERYTFNYNGQENEYYSGPMYLAQLNNVLFWTVEPEAAEIFVINRASAPTANDAINAATITVLAKEGAVEVIGAAGKKVVVSNILGQVVANTVIASDDATIAVPAGVVVVAVEGEAAVKAIVK